jgi:hypothetical protein
VNRAVAITVASTLMLATCALTRDQSLLAWISDWNQRVDTATTPFEHPCATKAFIAWADGFLAGCETDAKRAEPGCAARLEWVDERVEQCRAWTAWQLRNFNKHERSEGAPPPMRIE